jgi:hypothetical protein
MKNVFKISFCENVLKNSVIMKRRTLSFSAKVRRWSQIIIDAATMSQPKKWWNFDFLDCVRV